LQPRAVFNTSFFQGWRRWLTQSTLPAHFIEAINMLLASSLMLKTRINVDLVHRLSIQICDPCLDIPGSHEYGYSLI
jgi:hypothetical protein